MFAFVFRFAWYFVQPVLASSIWKRFMSSKAALGVAGGLGLFLAFEAGNWHGHSECLAAGQAQALQIAKRDLEIQRNAAAAAANERDALQRLADNLQAKVTDYETELSKRSTASTCRLNDADIKRLRNIK